MRFVLAAVAVVAALSAALATARRRGRGRHAGPAVWWNALEADDAQRHGQVVRACWTPAATSVSDIAKLTAPAKITTARSSAFQKQVWGFTDVLQSYRLASNGELVFQLFDVPTSTLHERVSAERGVSAEGDAWPGTDPRNEERIPQAVPRAQGNWQPLGATVSLSGVGFWNPVRTTAGA